MSHEQFDLKNVIDKRVDVRDSMNNIVSGVVMGAYPKHNIIMIIVKYGTGDTLHIPVDRIIKIYS